MRTISINIMASLEEIMIDIKTIEEVDSLEDPLPLEDMLIIEITIRVIDGKSNSRNSHILLKLSSYNFKTVIGELIMLDEALLSHLSSPCSSLYLLLL